MLKKTARGDTDSLSPVYEKEYIYGCEEWKDVFTGIISTVYVDGTAGAGIIDGIRYDNTGRPVEYTSGRHMDWGYGRLVSVSDYDSSDKVCSFMYNGDRYIYLSNGLKDITGIIDEDGVLVAEYHYDGYGSCEVVNYGSSTIGYINPFRYRGYYYDEETGFYYLNSRYYDPETERFISADGPDYLGASGTVLSYNLFAYCENKPVNCIDRDGKWLERVVSSVIFAKVFYALADVLIRIISLYVSIDNKGKLKIKTICTVLGATIGGVVGPSLFARYMPNLLKALNKIETKNLH